MRRLPLRRLVTLATLAVVGAATLGTTAACGDDSDGAGGSSGPVTLRLGYFPNITHAHGAGRRGEGHLREKLGSDVKLETEDLQRRPGRDRGALLRRASTPPTSARTRPSTPSSKSKGEAVRIIAGAASGGVALVVKPGSPRPQDLKGKKIATPQLGNTQDVALRYWLKEKGLNTTKEGGGDVKIMPQENAHDGGDFNSGAIDGAWVPEPSSPGWSTPAARCSSTSATCGRTRSSSSPT